MRIIPQASKHLLAQAFNAGNRRIRFAERGWEMSLLAIAPNLDPTPEIQQFFDISAVSQG
jgi:hypothetical protein